MKMKKLALAAAALVLASGLSVMRMQPNAKTECVSLYRLPKETGRIWQ